MVVDNAQTSISTPLRRSVIPLVYHLLRAKLVYIFLTAPVVPSNLPYA